MSIIILRKMSQPQYLGENIAEHTRAEDRRGLFAGAQTKHIIKSTAVADHDVNERLRTVRLAMRTRCVPTLDTL